jgi:superfamily II DNA or RNA helicase
VKLLQSLILNDFAHDGSDTGVGKTYIGAALVKALGEEALIICPLSIVHDWEEALHGFGAFNYTVINYESAWRRLGAVRPWGSGSFFQFHRKYPLTVFDEVHRAGGETTINSKMLIAAKRAGGKVTTISATVADSPMRMKAFGFAAGLHDLRDYTTFLLEHQCKPGTFGGWTFSSNEHPEVLPILHDKIYGRGLGSRLRKSEIPNFPKSTTEVRLLGNPDKTLLRMSEELRGYYNGRAVVAEQFARKAEEKRERERLAAEANGEEYDEDKPTGEEMARLIFLRQSLEAAMIPLIGDQIEDALEDSKVAVFCSFNETIEQLKKLASSKKWTCGVIRGTQSKRKDAAREETIKAFQANQLDCLFCNSEAGGVGVSLHDPVTQIPRTMFICPTFSGITLKQVLGRGSRLDGGFCRNILLFFEDSYQGVIARIVRGKLNNIDLINDADLTGNFKFNA